jgi:tetratricopeptide (TPR) repeat protein
MGRFPEAVEEALKAQQIDPLSLAINATLAGRYRDAGQYDQAINFGQRTLEMDPNFVPAHSVLGATYEAEGNWAQAILEYQKAVELSQNNPTSLAALGCAYGYSGNREKARDILATLRDASKIHYVSAFDMAAVFAGMGENDNAFHWLEKSYSERESQMAFLGITRRMNGVRSDPRYSDLLHRMHLNPPSASN